MSGVQQIEIKGEDADQRLDRWFKRHFPTLGHGRLEKLLRTGQIRLDGKRAKAGDRVEAGQVIRVPPLGDAAERLEQPQPRRPRAADDRWVMTLKKAVLYKDDDVLVIDKPAGLAVQGGTGLSTSVDDLLDALQFDGEERPRLVHRLDRDTSGVLALARTVKAAQRLTDAFRHKDARKIYWAVVVGVPEVRGGRIDAPLQKAGGKGAERVHVDEDGKRAVTEFAVIEKAGKKAAWLALMPVTGRTHQLRAHCVALGTPILGDGKYAGAGAFLSKDNLPRQLHLHARRLRLPHPGGKGWIDVTAPLPEHMRKTWSFFGFAAKPERDPFADLDR